MPLDNLLIYATGGLIYGEVQTAQAIIFSSGSGNYAAASKNSRVGPTVGGGIELLLPGPWSAKVEALYYDLGTVRTVAEPQAGAAVNFSDAKKFGFRGGLIRLGINVRLGDIIY